MNKSKQTQKYASVRVVKPKLLSEKVSFDFKILQ